MAGKQAQQKTELNVKITPETVVEELTVNDDLTSGGSFYTLPPRKGQES